MINKQTYELWEQNIINNLYIDDSKKTKLIPTNNNYSIVKRIKTIIFINFINDKRQFYNLVINNSIESLPIKHKIKLHHIGNNKLDGVSSGLDNNTFYYPATDNGGLTNLKQKLGTKVTIKKIKFKMTDKTNLKITNKIYSQWLKYSQKSRFKGNIKPKLYKFIKSLKQYLICNYHNCYICFHTLPTEHRIIYTSHDIKKLTGKYYKRVFDKDYYAEEVKPNNKLFCSITKDFITPNINTINILNEYTTY